MTWAELLANYQLTQIYKLVLCAVALVGYGIYRLVSRKR